MKILIACESSGVERRAFRALGHDAWSCDTLPSDDNSNFHFQCDVRELIRPGNDWDMMIAHPPCTRLTVAGARWFKGREKEQDEAATFFMEMINAPIPKIAVENPKGVMSTRYRKPDQIVQPWMFGHPETKGICLWLKNLPLLVETNNVRFDMLLLPKAQRNRVHWMGPSKDRWKARSMSYSGVASAMAQQWGV